jgi:hypothetical protein
VCRSNFGMGRWSEEVFLTRARAAVEIEKQRITEPGPAWTARYTERIAAAEALLTSLPENERPKQRRHIASLRRVLALGPHGTTDSRPRRIGQTETVQGVLCSPPAASGSPSEPEYSIDQPSTKMRLLGPSEGYEWGSLSLPGTRYLRHERPYASTVVTARR